MRHSGCRAACTQTYWPQQSAWQPHSTSQHVHTPHTAQIQHTRAAGPCPGPLAAVQHFAGIAEGVEWWSHTPTTNSSQHGSYTVLHSMLAHHILHNNNTKIAAGPRLDPLAAKQHLADIAGGVEGGRTPQMKTTSSRTGLKHSTACLQTTHCTRTAHKDSWAKARPSKGQRVGMGPGRQYLLAPPQQCLLHVTLDCTHTREQVQVKGRGMNVVNCP